MDWSLPRKLARVMMLGGALLAATSAMADKTIGLFLNDPRAFQGYTLFPPNRYTCTYLINNAGCLVHAWPSNNPPGQSADLLEDGHLLRSAELDNPTFTGLRARGGVVQEFTWEGDLVWEFNYSTPKHCQHHDIQRLPNGNTLIIAWELKSQAEALEAGRNPALVSDQGLWPDHILELKKAGPTTATVVWEWHVWDHLIQDYDPSKRNYGNVADHPELIDLNFAPFQSDPDWNHTNSVDYNAAFDQLLLSARISDEVWVIDHSTTKEEAAGHSGGRYGRGGDLLYRWGNPQAYRRGTPADEMLYGQHDCRWIPSGCPGAGNILIFNNGVFRPGGDYSSVDEITPPVDAEGRYSLNSASAFGPATLTWTYAAPVRSDMFAYMLSGAQRLPNGNTLICNGTAGVFFEVTAAGETAWKYVNPVQLGGPMKQGTVPDSNFVFRIRRYAPDYPGLAGRDLTPQCVIELPESENDGPDLTGTFTRLWHSQNNRRVKGKVSIANHGNADAGPFTVRVYLSADSEVTTNDLLLGSYRMKALQTSATRTLRFCKTLRSGVSAAGMHVVVAIDAEDAVSETNECNNCVIKEF